MKITDQNNSFRQVHLKKGLNSQFGNTDKFRLNLLTIMNHPKNKDEMKKQLIEYELKIWLQQIEIENLYIKLRDLVTVEALVKSGGHAAVMRWEREYRNTQSNVEKERLILRDLDCVYRKMIQTE